VKSSIDSRPHKWGLANKNAKKEVMMETKNTEIERENRILLEKMAHIMSNKKGSLS
jgi:hypothetical protein